LPLYGVPFAVKDSIDVEGMPTTLSCPDYSYVASTTAPVVRRLLDAGALYVGKTNLDQFATGLNGTRTPYTIPRSIYGGEMISGGSSSGSALAVALGQVPFAVATDTAGSGRVPAALNGVVGFKPSRGLISTVGLVPACKSLDCISVMAGSIDDVDRVFDVVAARDDNDAWSRDRGARYDGSPIRVGLPPAEELEFFGDDEMRHAHDSARLTRTTIVVDVSAAVSGGRVAALQGPWVAERLVEFAISLPHLTRGQGTHQNTPPLRRSRRSGSPSGALCSTVPTIGTTFTVDVLARRSTATRCSAITRTSETCSIWWALPPWRHQRRAPSAMLLADR
jgi:allophanate hydrolase